MALPVALKGCTGFYRVVSTVNWFYNHKSKKNDPNLRPEEPNDFQNPVQPHDRPHAKPITSTMSNNDGEKSLKTHEKKVGCVERP